MCWWEPPVGGSQQGVGGGVTVTGLRCCLTTRLALDVCCMSRGCLYVSEGLRNHPKLLGSEVGKKRYSGAEIAQDNLSVDL